MKIHQGFRQGDEAWYKLRRGRVTASGFDRIMTAVKCQYSAQAPAYQRDLLVECFCPDYAKFLGNKWTDRGTEMEPEAREAFRKHTGRIIEEVAFVTAERWDHLVGCSPDALEKNEAGEWIAGVEIKCPSPFTHAEYIEKGELPDAYKMQCHGGMIVTGLDEWHFWSYFPGLAPFHVIVRRDDFTAKLEAAIDRFVIEYGAYREKMTPLLQLKPDPEQY
jgi:hypothetical protein